jgi:hypothetical protein
MTQLILHLSSSPDAISENNPRVIDDSRARKLASDLKRCSYYETCATYGLNVERVFQDGEYFVPLPVSSTSVHTLQRTKSYHHIAVICKAWRLHAVIRLYCIVLYYVV